jgi:hypothetical protein
MAFVTAPLCGRHPEAERSLGSADGSPDLRCFLIAFPLGESARNSGEAADKLCRCATAHFVDTSALYDQRPCRWTDPNRHLVNLPLVTTADGAAASEAESRASRGVHGWRTSEGTRAAGRRSCAVAVRVDAFKSQL